MKKITPVIVSRRGTDDTKSLTTPARQRHGPLFALFCVWFLSLPFHNYSLVGTYSFDNMVAPLLCLAVTALPRLRNSAVASRRRMTLQTFLLIYCLFWVASLLPIVNSSELLLQRGWLGFRLGLYAFVVALFIRDRWSFKIVKSLLVLITMIAAVSALLDSLGWIHLPEERYEASRLGLDWLPKAIGLFSSYGDVAMLYAFTATVLISHTRGDLALGLGSRLGKLFVWFSLLAGLAGSQSRNIALTTMLAVGAYWAIRKLTHSQSSTRLAAAGMLMAIGISVLGVLAVFGGDVAQSLGGLGGDNAAKTADWRLDTFGQALGLIAQYPLIGVTTDIYKQWGHLVEYLHNTWLRVLLEGGVIRFTALLVLVWVVARGGFRNLRSGGETARDASVVVAMVVAILMATQFYGGLSDVMWVLIGTLLSFTWVSRDTEQVKAQ